MAQDSAHEEVESEEVVVLSQERRCGHHGDVVGAQTDFIVRIPAQFPRVVNEWMQAAWDAVSLVEIELSRALEVIAELLVRRKPHVRFCGHTPTEAFGGYLKDTRVSFVNVRRVREVWRVAVISGAGDGHATSVLHACTDVQGEWYYEVVTFEPGEDVIVERFGGFYADHVAVVVGDFVELEMGGTAMVANVHSFDDPEAQAAMKATLHQRRSEDVERALLAYETDPSDENRERLVFLSSRVLHAADIHTGD